MKKSVKAPDAVIEPIFYEDGDDWRIVDLRPHGVDCMPLFAFGNFGAVRPGARPHIHPGHIEVCLCLRGNLRYESDGIEYPVLPGHVFISRPNEPHRRCDNPKGMMLYRLLFAIPGKGESMLGMSAKESEHIVRALEGVPTRLFHATPRLRAAFVRLFALFDAPCGDVLVHRLEMRNAATELMLALVEAPLAPHSAKGRPTSKVRKIAERMSAHPEDDYPVAVLAAEVSLSPYAFTEAFKQATGLTPHAYLIDKRVRRAADDLKNGRGSIAVVADKWRFSSSQHMATAFRRILGVLPKQIYKRSSIHKKGEKE